MNERNINGDDIYFPFDKQEEIETANMHNKPFVTVEFIDKCIEAGSPVDHTPYLIPALVIVLFFVLC
jgi:hypothetical protein